jgi:hypothetical protein
VSCQNRHAEGFPLWVTFPFDAATPEVQPEVLARVVRTRQLSAGGAGEEVAVHFEGVPRSSDLRREEVPKTAQKNGTPRTVSLAIRVRPRHIPWHEEAMTVEVSSEKVLFLSNREYPAGETLLVTFVNAEVKPWLGAGEIPAKIVNVEKMPQSSSLLITLKRIV